MSTITTKNNAPVKSLKDLFQALEKRPGMFLGKSSIYRLYHYLSGVFIGYHLAYDELKIKSKKDHYLLEGFSKWVELKYKIFSPAYSWARILEEKAGDKEKALQLFFELLPEYIKDVEKIGIEGINKEHRQYFKKFPEEKNS